MNSEETIIYQMYADRRDSARSRFPMKHNQRQRRKMAMHPRLGGSEKDVKLLPRQIHSLWQSSESQIDSFTVMAPYVILWMTD